MRKQLLLTIATLAALCAQAQTSSDFMAPMKQADTTIEFDVNAEGKEYPVSWGMDAAWDWDFNINRGVNYIGKAYLTIGRVAFQPTDLVSDNGDGTYELTDSQKKAMKSRCDHIRNLTGTTLVNMTADQEAYYPVADYVNNYYGKVEEWYKLIKASVKYCKELGMTVYSISPYNEPDYSGWKEGSQAQFRQLCKLIREDSYFDGIDLCGGNTLNCDQALSWYNAAKDYLGEGNTHQLAGSFDSYANFFAQVKQDGKIATADELHNVGEAIVGVNYGMERGIWWGFDARARGQFCIDSNEGVRLGYGENRGAWMSGAVYRNEKTYAGNDRKTYEVHGYIGSSERQATPASFAFASTAQDVYFNGYGPTRMYVFDMPGGTGYQKGQINAERIIDITWGEDVPSGMIDGTYAIVNSSTGKALYRSPNTGARGLYWVSTGTIPSTGATAPMQWKVNPNYTSGDISYWFIDNVTDNEQRNLNVLDNNMNDGAQLITFNAGHDHNEQWYLKYVKDGYYYIINRLTNTYLCSTSSTEVALKKGPGYNSHSDGAFLWRFQPIDSGTDNSAPRRISTAPTAKRRAGSIELSWTRPDRVTDSLTYIVARAEVDEEGHVGIYNTIGRNIPATTFTDNTALPGKTYSYKVRCVDYAGNRSTSFSPVLAAATLTGPALLCQLQFDGSLSDNTANHLNAAMLGSESYSTFRHKSGEQSLYLNGSTHLMLPYSMGQQDEMTIAMWTYWEGGNNWQRLFDFGNSTSQYMFLCPSNGSEMRFVLKNRGDEQILSAKKLDTGSWHHIAVTLKPDGGNVSAVLYLDGTALAQKDDFTIRPSDIAASFCYVGRSMFAADPMYKGYLDDFRLYNYALSAEEVKGLMTDLDAKSADLDDSFTEVTTGILAPDASAVTPAQAYGTWHDLSGRPATPSQKGILIHQGKKYIQR